MSGNDETSINRKDTVVAETMPLVSIVIPVYNHGRHLTEAIQSVLEQDYQNIELIVLDDGSTDNTREILSGYGDRFYWETHKNMGQANTLNKGWRVAKGEILSYLSADDILLPNAVSLSIGYLRGDVVLTYCDFNLIDSSSRIIRYVKAPEFSYSDMFTEYICHPGPGVFMTKAAFEKAGLWDSSLRQMPDYDYWLRLGLVGDFKRVPQLLASFRVHAESQTHAKADEQKAQEPIRIIQRFIENNKLNDRVGRYSNQAMSNAYLVSAQLHIRANRFGCGWRNIVAAISTYPRILIRFRTYRILLNGFFNHLLHRLVRFVNQFLRSSG